MCYCCFCIQFLFCGRVHVAFEGRMLQQRQQAPPISRALPHIIVRIEILLGVYWKMVQLLDNVYTMKQGSSV